MKLYASFTRKYFGIFFIKFKIDNFSMTSITIIPYYYYHLKPLKTFEEKVLCTKYRRVMPNQLAETGQKFIVALYTGGSKKPLN